MTSREKLCLLAVLLVVAGSAWLLVTRGMASVLARTSPVAALQWHAGNPEALLRVNESETDPQAKATRARAVLGRRPMDGRAYRQLAELQLAVGHTEAARTLYRIAVRYSPRDRLSQAWLADDALARGDLAEMIARVGLLASMDGTLEPPLIDYLAQLAGYPQFAEPLAEVLQREPRWRRDFLRTLAQDDAADVALDRMFRALVSAGATLSSQERALWAGHLIDRGRWDAAYRVWAEGVDWQEDRRERDAARGIFNGGFETEPSGAFDWRFASTPGSRVDRLATAGDRGDHALRVGFAGRRVDFADVEQLLLLEPGSYRFKVDVRIDGLRSDRGLVWRVRCLPDGAVLGTGPALHGAQPWHASSFDFTVPGQCPAQRLRLELPARTAIERMISGVAWFDDATIVRLADKSPGESGTDNRSVPLLQAPQVERQPARSADCRRRVGADAPARPGCIEAARTPLPTGRTLQIVGSIIHTVPNAAGNRDPDVPVAP